jgi:hypothetical protein
MDAQQLSLSTRDKRIADALDLTYSLPRKLGLRGQDYEDAVSDAMLILTTIASQFDPSKNHNADDGWRPYAVEKIRWGLAEIYRSKKGRGKEERKQAILLGDHDGRVVSKEPNPVDDAHAASLLLCKRCQKLLPDTAFCKRRSSSHGWQHWCKSCIKTTMTYYRQTDEDKAWRKQYLQREDVKAKQREYEKRRKRKKTKKRPRTARELLIVRRNVARHRLSKETDPTRQQRLITLIERHTRDLTEMPTTTKIKNKPRCTKLTWRIVGSMRMRYDAGTATMQTLAKQYGVTITTVSHVINYQTWKLPNHDRIALADRRPDDRANSNGRSNKRTTPSRD